jgi:hypothetical protein
LKFSSKTRRISGVSCSSRLARAGLAENLVGPLELAVLALELLEPLTLSRRQPGPRAAVALGLPHPLPQRLARAAHFAGDRTDRRPLRPVRRLLLENQPDGTLLDLSRIPASSSHGSILSSVGASGKAGAIHQYQRARSPWNLNKRLVLEKAQFARLLRAYDTRLAG